MAELSVVAWDASSEYGTDVVENVDDDNPSTYWAATSDNNERVSADLGSAQTVGRVDVYSKWDGALGVRCKNFKLQYSDNNSDWYDQQSFQHTNSDGNEEFEVTSPSSHRYWRVYIIDTWGTGGSWIRLHELSFFGITSVTVYPDALSLVSSLEAPTVFPIITITPSTLLLSLTQLVPDISSNCTISPDVLSLILSPNEPITGSFVTILPDTFSLSLTQHPSSIIGGVIVSPPTLSLVLTQHSPTEVIDFTLLPPALSLSTNLLAPTVYNIVTVSPDVFTLNLSLQTPTVMSIVTVFPDVFRLELIQAVPLIPLDCTIYPSAFTLSLLQQIANPCIGWPTMTPEMLAALIDPYSGGAWLWLAEIEIPGYSGIRLARNTKSVIYSGNTFPANNFDVGLSAIVGDGSIPRIVLKVAQDKNRTLEDKVNSSKGACGGLVKLIRVHENFLTEFVDELEMTVNILNAESDTDSVVFNLGIPNPLLRKVPIRRETSKICPYAKPGLFKGAECQYDGEDTTCTGKFSDCTTKGNQIHWGGELGLDPNNTRI